MYLLRRAAVRALIQQPSRQLSTFRSSTTRLTVLKSTKPTLSRTFYQTRIWRAEEQEERTEALQNEAAAAAEVAETAAESSSPGAAERAAEEALQAADAAVGQAATNPEPVEPAHAQASNVQAEGVAFDAQNAAQSAAAAASTASPSATQQRRPPEPFPGSSSSATAGTSFRNAQPSRILYIGNLFFEVTAAQLEAEFSRFGRITNSRVVTDARGLSKGFGYIEFDTQESADAAVRELDQKVFQGRRMAVQYHVRRETRRGFGAAGQKEPNPPSKTLFIGNMSYQMSDRDLNDLFREIRDVLDVRVAIDRRSGQPRGFAHADFIDIPSAQRAKEHLEKKVVYGRQLRVDFSQSSSAVQNA